MFTDFIGGFLGALGGLAAGVVALRYLLGKYIEMEISKDLAQHQHELDKNLATLESSMTRLGDVLSRRNEREFAVVERAWELLIETFGLMQGHFGVSSKPVSHFKDMNNEETDKFIAGLGFLDDGEKERLLHTEPENRDALYERYELWRRYEIDQNAWQALKNYLNTHEIFFSEAIFTGFKSVQEKLNEIEGKVSALSSAVRDRSASRKNSAGVAEPCKIRVQLSLLRSCQGFTVSATGSTGVGGQSSRHLLVNPGHSL